MTTDSIIGKGRRALHTLLCSLFVFVTVAAAAPAHAQIPVTDTAVVTAITGGEINDAVESAFVEAAVLSVVNGVNYFTTQLAYQAAMALTTSCPGQVVCWNSKSFSQGFREAWQGAIGEAVGTLSDQAGFSALGFNLCNPGLNISLKIQLGLLDQIKPPAPKCDYGALVGNWSALSQSLQTGEILNQLKPVFEQGQSPLSVSLEVFGATANEKKQAELNNQMQRLMDAAAGGGFSDVRDPVSGRTKSPASVVHSEFEYMRKVQKEAPGEYSADIAAGQIASRAVTSVVVNTVSTFTQTLVAGLWNKLAQGLLSTEELVAGQPDLILNPDAILSPSGVTNQALATTNRIRLAPTRDAGVIDPLLDFSTCPTGNRSPKNCVVDQQFANAVRVADATPLTIREAMRQGLLHADWPLISASDAAKNQDAFCYTYGYCESNLKKLRGARIISIGWEIAASESPVSAPVTLKTVVDGFADCNDNGVKDAAHPFCKLIDPDWVLRAPLTMCRAMGFGEQLLDKSLPTRAEVCVDQQTCLKQDENGNCIGGWGYCTKEQNVWRFAGDSCPAQYNTCRVMTARTGGTRSYTLNTIDHGICNADTVGCRQYATEQAAVTCNLGNSGTNISNGLCTADNCLCTTSLGSCTVAKNQQTCTDVAAGRTCSLSGLCNADGGCACTTSVSCNVKRGEHSCSSVAGVDSVAGDDWLASPSLFLNAKAQTCDASGAGCTSLVRLGTGQALNLIRNGGFEETEDGDGDGNTDHAAFWSPFGATPDNVNGSLSRASSLAASGDNAMRVGGPAVSGANATCTLPASAVCSNAQGCACETAAGFGCRVANQSSTCSTTGRIIQDGIQFKKNTTYTLSITAVPASGSNEARGSAVIHFYDLQHANAPVPAGNLVVNSRVTGTADGTASENICRLNSSGEVTMIWGGTKSASGDVRGVTGTCTFVVTGGNIASGYLEIGSGTGNPVAFLDNVILSEGGGSPFHEGYGDTGGAINVKVAPAYLGCSGEANDRPECANYAGVCRENELGCEAYRPTNGDPLVPGVISQNDLCPAACAGYDTFKKEASDFDQSEYPVHFIPSTAVSCSESDVGCSEFTNTETEEVSYFSRLRMCTKPEDPTNGTYYSWEGSETTGFQLRNWFLKNTTTAAGVVTPVSASLSDVLVSGAATGSAGAAPCTKLDANGLHCASRTTERPSGSTDGLCSRADIDGGNLDCREFYDAAGNRHYRLLSKTIIASSSCFAYRITTSTQTDCANSNGSWNSSLGQCIYNADLGQSNSCTRAVNNCRAYKGNAATNVRSLINEGFESGLGNWQDSDDDASDGIDNLSQSAESVVVGGHSMKIAGTGASRSMTLEVGGKVAAGRSYTMTFWARGNGHLSAAFRNAATPVSCSLFSACAPGSGVTSCPCTTDNGLTCNVAAGATTCSVPAVAADYCTTTNGVSDCAFAPGRVRTTNDWKQFTIGPVIVAKPAFGTGPTRLVVRALGACVGGTNAGTACSANSQCTGGGTCAQPEMFVDNVILKEVQDNIFVVRDSWRTPASCDTDAAGSFSPQEMLGCKEYRKSDGSSVYLRSFTNICREKAIGCSVYSNTQNTPQNPYAESYNAVCQLKNANGSARICNSSPSCICDYNYRHPAAQSGAPVVKPDVCRVSVGQSECRFTLDRIDDSTRLDMHPDRVHVSADQRSYLVVSSKNLCSADQLGCKAVGQAHEAYETSCTLKDSAGAAKSCDQRACVRGGNACTSNGDCATGDVCGPSSCTCVVGNSSCSVAYGQDTCTAPYEHAIVDKWVNATVRDLPANYAQTLCKQEAVQCDAFTTSDGVQYFKDPGDRVCEYKSGITYEGELRSGWFRRSPSGSFFPCYPELLREGTSYEIYKNADASCRLSTQCTDPGGCDCFTAASPTVAVCRVANGGTGCGYQGWVGACESQYDRCEEFIDPSRSSPANPDGVPYYYLVNNRLDRQTCAGTASLKQGCVLFKQTSNTANLYSAAATYYKSERDAQNGKVAPVNCSLTPHDPACDNRCVSIPAGVCSGNNDLVCRNDGECRRCSNNSAIVCSKNSDCGSGNTCGAPAGTCSGTKVFTTSCQNDLTCNRGGGEICVGATSPMRCSKTVTKVCAANSDCPSGESCAVVGMTSSERARNTRNDTNIILKVNPDRQCAEWLSCRSYDTVWDEQAGQYKSICSGFGPCVKNAQNGGSFDCVQTVEPEKKVFNATTYSMRNTSWGGIDYSGFTVAGQYSPAFATPLSIVGGICVNSFGSRLTDANGLPQQCVNNSDCGDNFCRKQTGICMGRGDERDGNACSSNSDCCDSQNGNCTGNGFCSFSYPVTHRFAAVLEPDRTCLTDTDCSNARTRLGAGKCVDHRCAYNMTGGRFDVTNVQAAPRCRAYPESDAPYGMSVLDIRGNADHPGYDEFGQGNTRKNGFSAANVCGRGNDCSCGYSRWEFGRGGKTLFLSPPGTSIYGPITYGNKVVQGELRENVGIPMVNNQTTGICVGGPQEGQRCDASKKVVAGDPLTDPCNSEGGGSCQRLTNVNYVNGWQGFCLDPDKSMNVGADPNKFECNLWLPVDQLQGAPDNYNQFVEAGFNPSQSQMLYCVAAQGNAHGTGDDPYKFVVAGSGSGFSDSENSEGRPLFDMRRTGTFPFNTYAETSRNGFTYPRGSQPLLHKSQILAVVLEGPFDFFEEPRTDEPIPLKITLTDTNNWWNQIRWSDGGFPTEGVHENPKHGNENCPGTNCMVAEATWGANGLFTGVVTRISEQDNDDGPGGQYRHPHWEVKVSVILRENCVQVAQTHDSTKQQANFAWTDRLSVTTDLGTDADGRKWFAYTNRVGAVDPSMQPYGRIEPSGLDIDADKTTLGMKYPLTIAQSEGGSPYSFVTGTGKVVPEDPYAFTGPNKSTANSDVFDAAGYPYGCKGPCALSAVSNQGAGAIASGQSKLSQYFAWTFVNFVYDEGNGSNLAMTQSSSYNSSNPGYDAREANASQGHVPRVVAVMRGNCGAEGLCEEGPFDPSGKSGLTVGDSIGANDVVAQSRGKYTATIAFYAYADKNRMPIRRKIIDFGDGTTPKSTDGAFKNHRGCPAGQPNCGSATKFCGTKTEGENRIEWGRTNESCDPHYFQETHTYVCTATMVGSDPAKSLPVCNATAPRYPCKARGDDGGFACHFKPRVQILDNWGFCNGTCNGLPGGASCFNQGVGGNDTMAAMRSVFDKSQADITCDSSIPGNACVSNDDSIPRNECRDLTDRRYITPVRGVVQQPWTEFGKVIIVKP